MSDVTIKSPSKKRKAAAEPEAAVEPSADGEEVKVAKPKGKAAATKGKEKAGSKKAASGDTDMKDASAAEDTDGPEKKPKAKKTSKPRVKKEPATEENGEAKVSKPRKPKPPPPSLQDTIGAAQNHGVGEPVAESDTEDKEDKKEKHDYLVIVAMHFSGVDKKLKVISATSAGNAQKQAQQYVRDKFLPKHNMQQFRQWLKTNEDEFNDNYVAKQLHKCAAHAYKTIQLYELATLKGKTITL